MYYEFPLQFLRSVFKKYHLQTLVLDPAERLREGFDMGLRKSLGIDDVYSKSMNDYIKPIQPQTIYRLKDSFSCYYLFLLLPEDDYQAVLSIGPYLSEEPTEEKIFAKAEKLSLQPWQTAQLKTYYGSVPLMSENNTIFAVLDTFAENIWGGGNNFSLVDVNYEFLGFSDSYEIKGACEPPENAFLNIKMMESRYAYENELMEAVTKGQIHKAEILFSNISQLSFESRLADPVRNLKNYGIIMNTLLRKAAEKGGVHPIYLDSISSSFARKIELVGATSAAQELMRDMFRSYCRLVRKHSMKNYSPPVQKAIIYIDSDLTADLSLSALADMQNLSTGYLSSLFRKETGETLTEHVSKKRVRLAMDLLKTTNLQVQTIAQHCGILDIHYFSKIFKKYTGVTPKKYREEK